MASVKSVAFTALLLVLNMHWAQCQYPGYPGYCPQICGRNDKSDLDTILPILILAMLGRNGNGFGGGCGGGYGGGCGGGYGGGCGGGYGGGCGGGYGGGCGGEGCGGGCACGCGRC